MSDDVKSNGDDSEDDVQVEDETTEAAEEERPAEEESDEPEVDPLTQAQREAEDYKDRWLRLAAEFDNYRKRTQRETQSLLKTASEGVVRDLLPILDSIDRALAHGKNADTESEGFLTGFQMTMEQLPKVLQSRGLAEIEAKGQAFDPNEHEALMQMPSDEFEAGLVSEVVEKGYRIGDKVIRPSKVVVSKGPLGPEESDEENGMPAGDAESVEDRKSDN